MRRRTLRPRRPQQRRLTPTFNRSSGFSFKKLAAQAIVSTVALFGMTQAANVYSYPSQAPLNTALTDTVSEKFANSGVIAKVERVEVPALDDTAVRDALEQRLANVRLERQRTTFDLAYAFEPIPDNITPRITKAFETASIDPLVYRRAVADPFTFTALPLNLDVIPEARPDDALTSPYAVKARKIVKYVKNSKGKKIKVESYVNAHLEAALARSADKMKALNLTRDSVIAWHDQRPITLAAALSDKDIHQLPPISMYLNWTASLAKYGFNRQCTDFSKFEFDDRVDESHEKRLRTLIPALAMQESSCFVSAVSFAKDGGALGMLQIMRATARGYDLDNPFSIEDAFQAAGAIMSENLDAASGNVTEALARYNWGPVGVERVKRRHGSFALSYAPAETRSHANGVERFMSLFVKPQRKSPTMALR